MCVCVVDGDWSRGCGVHCVLLPAGGVSSKVESCNEEEGGNNGGYDGSDTEEGIGAGHSVGEGESGV